MTQEMTERLEARIDELVADRPLPEVFIVPGANPASAALDVARSTIRRAERAVVALERDRCATVNPEVRRYLNRLSDLLFVLARRAAGEGEPPQSRLRVGVVSALGSTTSADRAALCSCVAPIRTRVIRKLNPSGTPRTRNIARPSRFREALERSSRRHRLPLTSPLEASPHRSLLRSDGHTPTASARWPPAR